MEVLRGVVNFFATGVADLLHCLRPQSLAVLAVVLGLVYLGSRMGGKKDGMRAQASQGVGPASGQASHDDHKKQSIETLKRQPSDEELLDKSEGRR